MICFSLLGGWCIKGVIKNPTPTPKYRKKRKQTVKLSVKRQTNGEFIDCVIYRKEFLPSIMFAAVYTHSISPVLSPACFSLVLFLPPPPPAFLPCPHYSSHFLLCSYHPQVSLVTPPLYSYFSLRSLSSFAPLSPHPFSFHSQIAFPNM